MDIVCLHTLLALLWLGIDEDDAVIALNQFATVDQSLLQLLWRNLVELLDLVSDTVLKAALG